jgi:hypothetical protein
MVLERGADRHYEQASPINSTGDTMPMRFVLMLVATAISTSALLLRPDSALAQAATPSLPGAPTTTSYPGGARVPQGAPGGSGSYSISAAANEHGAFLWVVDNVQHAVVLCEKSDSRDFTCSKKPLP